MSQVLVILPAYNEGERIGAVLGAIRELQLDWDLLVIDDGSADNTAAKAAAAGAVVISHPYNLGYGAALQTGYKYAARHGHQYVIQHDADGQHIPSEAERLLALVQDGKADMAIGSRLLEGGGGYQIPFLRKVGISLFSKLAGLLAGQKLYDVTSGLSAVNRKVILCFASDLFPADFPDADVRLMLLKLGLRLEEVPTKMRPGPANKSMHGGFLSIWYVIKMLLSIFIVWITRFSIPVDKENPQ